MDDLITALVHFCRGQGTQLKLWDIHFDDRCARHLVHFLTTTTTTTTSTATATNNNNNSNTRATPAVTSLWIQNCTFQQNEQEGTEEALSILCRFFASQQTEENSSSSSPCVLQTVSVKKCHLGNAGVHQLLRAFQDNRVVQTLDISYNNLTHGQCLYDLLKHNTTLQHLIIAGNPLFSRRIRHDDDDDDTDDDNNNAMRALRRGLLYNRTLASLNLSFCKLQNQDLHQLVVGDAKKHHEKQEQETFALTELWLENNQLQGIHAGTSLQRLVQYMAPNLQVLGLDSNHNLGVEGARVLAVALKSTTTTTTSKNSQNNDLKLRRLFISCCGLQEQGTDCIVAAISQNTSVIQLHISGNDSSSDTTTTTSSTTLSPSSCPKSTVAQQERKRLVQIYTKRNALWTRVVQPLLTWPSSSSSSSSPLGVVTAEQRSPLWAQACVTCAQHHAHHGASAVYALVSEMVGLDFFHD